MHLGRLHALGSQDLQTTLSNRHHKSCRPSTGSRREDYLSDTETEGVAMKTSVRRAFRSSARVEEKEKYREVGFSYGPFPLTIQKMAVRKASVWSCNFFPIIDDAEVDDGHRRSGGTSRPGCGVSRSTKRSWRALLRACATCRSTSPPTAAAAGRSR